MTATAEPGMGRALGEVALLELKGISVRFGGMQALRDVDVRISPGEIVGLIGPNGAGKTTLFNVLSGFLRPDSGRVTFDGRDSTSERPHRLAQRGLIRTWQSNLLISKLTTRENLSFGLNQGRRSAGVSPWTGDESGAVGAVAEQLGIQHLLDERAGDLSHGAQRLLGVGIALLARPRLLGLDEPAAGLNESEVERLGAVMRSVVQLGGAVVWVEHHIEAVTRICDRLVVLDAGRKIADGPQQLVVKDPLVIAAYLGKPDA